MDDLRRIMSDCAGVDDGVDLARDIGGVMFGDLGYDSLALLEMCGRVEREFGVRIPDDGVRAMATPGDAVVYINERIRET
jgi:act minimal PKS acyl carrier protein